MFERFICVQCGECCRNLLTEQYGLKLGLFLFPAECKLFPSGDIAPLYGYGVKGRSRPRPAVIGFYQYTRNICEHLTPDNKCSIYEKRPLACRAFPVEWTPEGIHLDRTCRFIREHLEEGETFIAVPAKLFPADVLIAETKITNAILAYARAYEVGWTYDLRTKRWVKNDDLIRPLISSLNHIYKLGVTNRRVSL